MVFYFFAKTVRQPCEASAAHADREIAAFNVAGRNLCRDAVHYLAAYRYYSGRAIAVGGVLPQISYRVSLDDDTVGAVAKRIADCRLIKDGKKQDAALHEPILAAGDHAKAQQIGIEVARRAGLTEEQIAKLYAFGTRLKRTSGMAWARWHAWIGARVAVIKTAQIILLWPSNLNLGFSGAWLYDSEMAMVTPNKRKNNETEKQIYMFYTRHRVSFDRTERADLLP
jgi:hypothetical protein